MSDTKNELPDEPIDRAQNGPDAEGLASATAVTPPLYDVVADQLDEVVYGEDPDVEEKS
ncbi:MAG: hypothetical protein KKH51_06100 [Actinobacteria bacterium]|nr:hypothetical protein [Actinomycetota bacterium]